MKRFTAEVIGDLIGVTDSTIRNWEGEGFIPSARRVGQRKCRVWTQKQVEEIMSFALSLGYSPKMEVIRNVQDFISIK